MEYPIFDRRLLMRCPQCTAASVFGFLDPFSETEFVVNHLKGAQTWDRMASCHALQRAIITNDFLMPDIVDLVANISGV